MKNFFVIIFSLILISCGKEASKVKTDLKSPSDFFPKEKANVLVVGTFHFDYPGLDVNKTADEDKIDVLREPKKSEVTELVEYIKKFKPTKIAIEAFDKWNAGEKLRKYNAGQFRDQRDERYQLALRIASELKLDTLYSIVVGDFKLDHGRGADILSIWWYNRNLRIFRKLQQITESPSDRILVIFGNGHAAILRQLLESSPEYEFVEFDSL